MNNPLNTLHVSRRSILAGAGAIAAATVGMGNPSSVKAQPIAAPALGLRGGGQKRPNLLFVFTDQERYATRWPTGLSLPGHERLARQGVTFHAH